MPMYITTKTRARGTPKEKTYVYLMKSEQKNKKEVKTVVKSYGEISKLSPEAKAEIEKYKNANAETKLNIQLEINKSAQELIRTIKTAVANDTSKEQNTCAFKLGNIFLKKLWDEKLGLKYKFDYIQRTKTKITSYSISDLLYHLAYTKLTNPSSYYGAFKEQSKYLYNPNESIHLDNYYNVLKILNDNKDEIFEFANKKIFQDTNTTPKLIFYDLTNMYFEINSDDKEAFIYELQKDKVNKLESTGKTRDEIEVYLKSKEFEEEINFAIQHSSEFLRMRGPSKESRFAQPLVALSLVIDDRGFPLDCKISPGNIAETKTVTTCINDLNQKYHIKNTLLQIVVLIQLRILVTSWMKV